MEVVIITITDPTIILEFQFCHLGCFLLFWLLLSFCFKNLQELN